MVATVDGEVICNYIISYCSAKPWFEDRQTDSLEFLVIIAHCMHNFARRGVITIKQYKSIFMT